MADLFVSPSYAGSNVIRVGGVCYINAGPSGEPPQSVTVDDEFSTCEECMSSSSSSSTSSGMPCTCVYTIAFFYDCNNPDAGWSGSVSPELLGDCLEVGGSGWQDASGYIPGRPTDDGNGVWEWWWQYLDDSEDCTGGCPNVGQCGSLAFQSQVDAFAATLPAPDCGSSSSSGFTAMQAHRKQT